MGEREGWQAAKGTASVYVTPALPAQHLFATFDPLRAYIFKLLKKDLHFEDSCELTATSIHPSIHPPWLAAAQSRIIHLQETLQEPSDLL